MVYKITGKFPESERYSMIDQMRRSASSVTANIAEGFGRHSYKEKVQFYYLAKGSLTELMNYILIARDVGYLSDEDFIILSDKADLTSRLLHGFIAKTKSFVNQ